MTKGTYEGYKRGQCNVTSDKGVLRISIPAKLFGGKRRYIYTGLRDTRVHVGQVQQVVDIMNGDLLRSEFDFSLERYKALVSPDGVIERNQQNCEDRIAGWFNNSLAYLWEAWVKSLNLSEETYNNKYKWIERYINQCNPDWNSVEWTSSLKVGDSTFNSYIGYVRRCINWALEEGLIKGRNPYRSLSKSTKGKVKKRKGFTKEEKQKVIQEFGQPTLTDLDKQRDIAWYYPMVCFWFDTGLRVGEIIALKWKDVDLDSGVLTVRRSLSRDHSNEGKGHRRKEKSTKTGNERRLLLSKKSKWILETIQPSNYNPNHLIFTDRNGLPINIDNWRNRVWKPLLKRAGVAYQPPKNIRHTLITEAAMDPEIGVVGAAKIAGHTTTKTVQEHYIDLHGVAQLPSSEDDQ